LFGLIILLLKKSESPKHMQVLSFSNHGQVSRNTFIIIIWASGPGGSTAAGYQCVWEGQARAGTRPRIEALIVGQGLPHS